MSRIQYPVFNRRAGDNRRGTATVGPRNWERRSRGRGKQIDTLFHLKAEEDVSGSRPISEMKLQSRSRQTLR